MDEKLLAACARAALPYQKAMVRKFEGLRLTAYLCPAKVWTCGYGSTGPDVKPGVVWTLQQSEDRMSNDVAIFLLGTLKICPNLVSYPRKAAAVADFSYNLGLSRLQSSTMRKYLLGEDWEAAGNEMMKWVRGGGIVLPGLVKRRAYNKSLLLSPDLDMVGILGGFQETKPMEVATA